MLLRIRWLLRNYLWWTGAIAIGQKNIQRAQNDRGFALLAGVKKLDHCKVCGVETLGWRRITLCKKFSCFREVH
ncbi:hypothetical protein LCGC14_0429810 [marine sediment metagenome]|uniref:Uncharacterized protein n=1 Tax=marine sediment metagenome TaxID=412755 RepID=A0A0F9SNG5_9ZZZZ